MKIPGIHFLDIVGPTWITYPSVEAPDTFGPDGVILVLERYRDFLSQKREELGREIDTLGDISLCALKKLVRLAYRASFLSDEGRPVRCRIAVRKANWLGRIVSNSDGTPDPIESFAPQLAAAFIAAMAGAFRKSEDEKLHQFRLNSPLRLETPKAIAKFAPLLADSGCAITVQEDGEDLVVSGIASLDKADVSIPTLEMPRLPSPSAGVLIEILGPGHLRVSEGRNACSLFADQLVHHNQPFFIGPIEGWLSTLSSALETRLKECKEYRKSNMVEMESYEELRCRMPIHHVDLQVMLAVMLRTAQSLGHGGMFAFLPNWPCEAMELRHELHPISLGEKLIEAWKSCCRVQAAIEGQGKVLDSLDEKQECLADWVRLLQQVACLAAADGCVVFDRECTLIGYGGIIVSGTGNHVEFGSCHHATSGEEIPRNTLLQLHGTRHKSAYLLCEQVDGAVVFVLSQDGDLKVFARSGEKIFFADSLQV